MGCGVVEEVVDAGADVAIEEVVMAAAMELMAGSMVASMVRA